MRVLFSRRASADIRGIWKYTAYRWGRAQAEIYLKLIDEGVDSIVADPKVGRPLEGLRRSYRRYAAKSHVLIYRVTAEGILLMRVLHRRMDFRRHL